jgi:hypothetical protein
VRNAERADGRRARRPRQVLDVDRSGAVAIGRVGRGRLAEAQVCALGREEVVDRLVVDLDCNAMGRVLERLKGLIFHPKAVNALQL